MFFSFSLISHSPETLHHIASREHPGSPAGRPSERRGALAIAVLALIAAVLIAL